MRTARYTRSLEFPSPRNSKARARQARPDGVRSCGSNRAYAATPWCSHHGVAAPRASPSDHGAITRAGGRKPRPARGYRLTGAAKIATGESRRSALPEPPGVDTVLLDLEVEGLVVGAQAPRRLGLVPLAGLEGLADRLALGVRRRRLGDLLERRPNRRWTAAARDRPGRVEQREVLPLDHTRSEEGSPAHDVPELPYVPRPGVAQQHVSRRLRDLAAGAAELHAGFCDEIVRQVKDVVSLPQGGQRDDDFLQAVVDILLEPARLHLSLQGDAGGSDGSHIHPFLQGTEQLGLRGEGKVDNLFEEQSSALGKGDFSEILRLIQGSGVAAPAVAVDGRVPSAASLLVG